MRRRVRDSPSWGQKRRKTLVTVQRCPPHLTARRREPASIHVTESRTRPRTPTDAALDARTPGRSEPSIYLTAHARILRRIEHWSNATTARVRNRSDRSRYLVDRGVTRRTIGLLGRDVHPLARRALVQGRSPAPTPGPTVHRARGRPTVRPLATRPINVLATGRRPEPSENRHDTP